MASALSPEFAEAGFVLRRNVVSEGVRAHLLELIGVALRSSAVRHTSGSAFAARGLLQKVPELSRYLDEHLGGLASEALGREAAAIDATFFDKHALANWAVPGHQDRIFAVVGSAARKQRVRDGIAYAEADETKLAELVALRIHFDDTDQETGALCVVPGSHRSGVMTTTQILAVPFERYETCQAAAGDVLLMRPLLLHRSSPSRGEGQRRVLHVVFAADEVSLPV